MAHESVLTNENWPIAAAMLPFSGTLPDGSSVQDQYAEGWAETLVEVADAGFEHVDPTDSWLRIGDLPPARLQEFMDVVKAAGLSIPAVSTTRRSVIDPEYDDENLAYEDPATGQIVTIPAPLEFGVINYRKAVRMAIDTGYRAPFLVEHYGGDGLSVCAATNREYLRGSFPDAYRQA